MITDPLQLPAIKAYADRIGAEKLSLRSITVRENSNGYWKYSATIRFMPDGTIKVQADNVANFNPTEREAEDIKEAVLEAKWPKMDSLAKLPTMPPGTDDAEAENLFYFKTQDGKRTIMVQHRVENDQSIKRFIPWTHWGDAGWQKMEPEGSLPIYNIEKASGHSVAFIHEGAGAARYVQEMVEGVRPGIDDHPWGAELKGAVHLGWIGGAFAPGRTNWNQLRKLGIETVYLVPDNDYRGKSAIKKISKACGLKLYYVSWGDDFPSGFDLADEFPAKMFDMIDGERFYTGLTFSDMIMPGTWATKAFMPAGSKKPAYMVTEEFLAEWVWVQRAGLFVSKRFPHIQFTKEDFNLNMLAISDVNNTAQKMIAQLKSDPIDFCFKPGRRSKTINTADGLKMNLWRPTTVRPIKGDPAPWLSFLEYFFPYETDRKHAMKWLATLIAKPEVRMEYGMILASEEQGLGKSTLCDRILRPLVGEHNYGVVTETQISDGGFNSWQAGKTLLCCHEIYAGKSWKVYNRLKSVITEDRVTVNKKYEREYSLENHATMVACSNDLSCMKLDPKDRRWFVPNLPEKKWSKQQFGDFFDWVKSGGLNIIAWWAKDHGSYVTSGEPAPMTYNKQEMIDASRSEAFVETQRVAEAYVAENKFLGSREINDHVKRTVHGYFTANDIKKALEAAGLKKLGRKVRVGKAMEIIWGPGSMVDEIEGKDMDGKELGTVVRGSLMPIDNLLADTPM